MSADVDADDTPSERIKGIAKKRWADMENWVDRRFGDEEFAWDAKLAQSFRPDAAIIEEAPVPVSSRATLYIALTLLVVAILWSIFGSLDRIVVASGKIVTRTPLLVMQPFTTSRVLQINVQAGDHVRKGQVLARFDPAFAQADVASLRHKVDALSAQAERLEAGMIGAPFAAKPNDARERFIQAQIYQQDMSSYEAEIKQRDSRLAQIDSQIAVDKASLPGISTQLDMANKVVEIQERLRAQAAAANLDVMRAVNAYIDAQLKLKNTEGDLTKLAGQRAEIAQEKQAYLEKWRIDHNQQLVQTRQDLSEAGETLNKAVRMHELTEMTAPVGGTVLEVADRSTGSVLREAETLLTLVPDGADLYVEANVPSRDVSYLKVGDVVRVKLEAYPFQRFGTANGVLSVISADSVPLKTDDAKSELVYKAQVRITDRPKGLAVRGIHVRPGLVASAEIKTGKRSIASYILNPVLRTADESMREP